MKKLTEFPEISAKLLAKLEEVGISSQEDLTTVGAKQAWLKMYGIDPAVSFYMLQTLEATVQGIPKAKLSKDDLDDLKLFFQRITKPIRRF